MVFTPEYTHGNLGYGRCSEPDWANDKFAVDYLLNKGDFLYSPFECGHVTFAGRNTTHRDYGVFVAIRACNNKYVSLSSHLSGLRRGISRGDRVYAGTVIGYAGDTGGGNIAVGPVHLHQAFYRYPKYNPDGAPYAGAGLQVTAQASGPCRMPLVTRAGPEAEQDRPGQDVRDEATTSHGRPREERRGEGRQRRSDHQHPPGAEAIHHPGGVVREHPSMSVAGRKAGPVYSGP